MRQKVQAVALGLVVMLLVVACERGSTVQAVSLGDSLRVAGTQCTTCCVPTKGWEPLSAVDKNGRPIASPSAAYISRNPTNCAPTLTMMSCDSVSPDPGCGSGSYFMRTDSVSPDPGMRIDSMVIYTSRGSERR